MTWLIPAGLTDGQAWMVCVGLVVLVSTGPALTASWWRRRHARPARPAGPYDWETDRCYRQPSHVRRVA